MKFKYDKKTMLFVAGAFFEIVTILGYHGLSYLTNQLGILHVLTVIFAGLYDFLESIWLIGSVALVAYLVYLLKNESSEVDKQVREIRSLSVCCMLVMLSGIYSMDVIKKHIDDLTSVVQWALETIAKTDFGVLAGVGLIFVAAAVATAFIQKIYKTFQPTRSKNRGLRSISKPTEKRYPDSQAQEEKYAKKVVSAADDIDRRVDRTPSGENINELSDSQKSQETETNSQEKLIGVAIFILLLPIFTVFIFAILQSNWLSDFEIFKGYKEVFRESTSIQLIVEKCTPLAMASTVIFVAAGAAIIIQKICKYLNSKKFGHPQALLAVIIEIIFFIALPRLKEINPFDSLLETMVEGGFSNTLVALAIFFIVIWLFLIMLSVPSDTEKTNNLENEIREECKTLFSVIQKIALGLLKSGIGLIRFATTDYIEAILGVFGIEEKKTDNLDKK